MKDDLQEKLRFGNDASEKPALLTFLQLNEEQATALNAWFEKRSTALKKKGWKGWNEGDMALRTICVQVDTYGKRAFNDD